MNHSRNLLTGTSIVILLVACAQAPVAPKLGDELVVVLPGKGAKVGGVVVRRNDTERILDTPYAASRIASEGKPEPVTLTPRRGAQYFQRNRKRIARPARHVHALFS